MSKPTIQIHNIETGEIVEREMNAAELKNYNEGIKLANDMQAKLEANAIAKAAILDRIGLTSDELKTILG
jgi:lipoate synthase